MFKTIIIGIGGLVRASWQFIPRKRTEHYLSAKHDEENFGIGLAVVLMLCIGGLVAFADYYMSSYPPTTPTDALP